MHNVVKKKNGLKLATAVISVTVLMSGCNSMKDVIEKDHNTEIAPSSKENEKENEDESITSSEDDFKLSKEQEKRLEEAESQSPQDAVDYNSSNLSVMSEISKNVPVEKEKYTDSKEASQYLSYILFQYHAALIDGETFYNKLKPHLADEFKEMLPKTDKDRVIMFETLQGMFSEQLEADIEEYAMTDLGYNGMTKEGTFYRKYTLYNGETIFYQTLLKNVDGVWKIANDEPSPGYADADSKQPIFNDAFVQERDNKQ